jgi:predicted deacylase
LGWTFALLSDRHDGDAFDEAFIKPWLALEAELARLGRPVRFGVDAWTVELGSGMALEAIAVQRGLSGMLNYLRHRGVLRDQPPIQVGNCRYARTSRLVKYYAPSGGFLQNRVALGTWVQAGDPLYDCCVSTKTVTCPRCDPLPP